MPMPIMYRAGRYTLQLQPTVCALRIPGESQPLDVSLIFQRFYHTKNRQTSTGLGLAMVDAICKRYGLTIAYSFDKGLHTFTLTQS